MGIPIIRNSAQNHTPNVHTEDVVPVARINERIYHRIFSRKRGMSGVDLKSSLSFPGDDNHDDDDDDDDKDDNGGGGGYDDDAILLICLQL